MRLTQRIAATLLLMFSVVHAMDANDVSTRVLPPPQALHMGAGVLTLDATTTIGFVPGNEVVARHFAERLRRGSGWPVQVLAKGPATIRLEIQPAAAVASPEAYTLKVDASGVLIRAATAAGTARGLETLMQLLPPKVYGKHQVASMSVPALTIRDAPRAAWRAAMLDVSRKFQDKETVLKLLDGLAACKLNIFHWHLTDDQGWRLPIEGYPKLTENVPAYSRQDIREVVQRADALGIMIVPEVDMPGHSAASCKAYPEIATLNAKGQPGGTMNPGADRSYVFIEAVMKDVAAQFPNSPYVHLGADEVGQGSWKTDPQCQEMMKREGLKNLHELYLYFINRAVKIARQHGKRSIAWDEAYDPKNDPELIIMCWRGMKAGIAAAKAGRTVIFAPNPPVYINHANTRSNKNPVAYSAHPTYINQGYYLPADTPAVPAANQARILGGEACLWSERITGPENMLIHMFPRVAAVAENLWLPREKLDWPGFLKRIEFYNQRLDAMGIPKFWEPETLAVNLSTWTSADLSQKNGVIEIPLPALAHAGEQEFFVTQTTGRGQFRVESVELLKDGAVVDTDRHPHESSVYQNVDCMYVVKNPDTVGKYQLRIHAKPLHGESAALIQYHAALAPDGYSKQCAPGSGANRSKQSPAR